MAKEEEAVGAESVFSSGGAAAASGPWLPWLPCMGCKSEDSDNAPPDTNAARIVDGDGGLAGNPLPLLPLPPALAVRKGRDMERDMAMGFGEGEDALGA